MGGTGQNFTRTQLISKQCDGFPSTPSLSMGTAPFTGIWQPSYEDLYIDPDNYWVSLDGIWTLTIKDMSGRDTGTLDSFILRFFDSGVCVIVCGQWNAQAWRIALARTLARSLLCD